MFRRESWTSSASLRHSAGHATLIDCHTLDVAQVPVPTDIDIVVEFVAHRTLVGSAYSDRVAECTRAEVVLGPLRVATIDDVIEHSDEAR